MDSNSQSKRASHPTNPSRERWMLGGIMATVFFGSLAVLYVIQCSVMTDPVATSDSPQAEASQKRADNEAVREAAFRADQELMNKFRQKQQRLEASKPDTNPRSAWHRQMEELRTVAGDGKNAPKGSVEHEAYLEMQRRLEDKPSF